MSKADDLPERARAYLASQPGRWVSSVELGRKLNCDPSEASRACVTVASGEWRGGTWSWYLGNRPMEAAV